MSTVTNWASLTFSCLQARAEEHSNILKGLQLLAEFQKESFETQNQQLSKLQNMVVTSLKQLWYACCRSTGQLVDRASSISHVIYLSDFDVFYINFVFTKKLFCYSFHHTLFSFCD